MIENGDALVVRDAGPAELRGGTITNPAAFVVETRITGDVRAIITLSALEAKTGKAAQAYAFQCAAAPEMLEALQFLADWKMRDGSPCFCPAGSHEDEPRGKMPTIHTTACATARAAIAKATGGQP